MLPCPLRHHGDRQLARVRLRVQAPDQRLARLAGQVPFQQQHVGQPGAERDQRRLGIPAQADGVAGAGQVQFQQLADGRVRVDHEDVCTHRNSWDVGFVSTTTGSNMHEAKSAEQYDFD